MGPVMDGGGGQQSLQVELRPEDLEGASRLLTSSNDPRKAVCVAAAWMLRADLAALWELGPDDELVMSATTEGSRSTPGPVPVEHALRSSTRVFMPDAQTH